MATVVDEANAYFPSISNLAARVFADVELVKQACMANGEWEQLTVEEQELIIDQVLIDSQVSDTYSSAAESNELPDCFPVVKVNSGEKIVVDFDHDDSWTWADEHSAPFSWKTKSQQDLSLDDIEDSCGTEGDRRKKIRFTKRLRSPDRSVWDISSYLLGGDRKNEIEKMFEKFKIKMAASDEDINQDDHSKMDARSIVAAGVSDSDISPAHTEHSKLIGSINKAYNTSVNDVELAVAVKDTKQDGENGGKKKHKHKKDKREKDKKSQHGKPKSMQAAEPESAGVILAGMQSTISSSDDIVFPTMSLQNSSDDVQCSFSHSMASRVAESAELAVHISCHVEDVFSETPGESNTDDVGSVDLNPLDFSTAELPLESDKSRSGTIKSGFEFLDEW